MSTAANPRNHVIDVARASSVAMVVVFHGLLYQIRVADGVPQVVPWAAPSWFYPLTWVLMVMPVFFIAGGFAHALVVDRLPTGRAAYAHFLANRGRRLVGPLLSFVTLIAVASSAAAWLGWLDAASELSRQVMQLLWFVTVYLVVIAAAPSLVRLHDRVGWPVMAGFLVVACLVDAWSFRVGDAGLRNLNMIVVWPLVHQFGIAYHRGWWRTGSAWWAWGSVVTGVAGVAVLVFGFGYPPTAVGFADLPIANVQPPTVAMAALGLAQCGVLGLVERSGMLSSVPAAVERVLGVVNALMVTVYLWHIPVIFVAGALLLALSLAVPAMAGVALFQLTVSGLTLLLLAVVAPLIGRVDRALIPPLGDAQDEGLAITAYGVLFLGTLAVWQAGAVMHPARPISTLGVIGVWAGAALMARASGARYGRLGRWR